jgi:L-amino acid N-acyltransferase YncA
LWRTGIDVEVKTCRELNSTAAAELRKLWVKGVQADANAVGWLPTGVFDERVRTNEVLAVYRNNDLVGWSLWGRSNARQVLKIYQVWVRPDARIVEHGRALVKRMQEAAAATNFWLLEAWVAEDLAANIFWKAIEFERGVWRWGRGERRRRIFRWVKLAKQQNVFVPGVAEFQPLANYA